MGGRAGSHTQLPKAVLGGGFLCLHHRLWSKRRKPGQLNKNLHKSPWRLRKGNKGFFSLLAPLPWTFRTESCKGNLRGGTLEIRQQFPPYNLAMFPAAVLSHCSEKTRVIGKRRRGNSKSDPNNSKNVLPSPPPKKPHKL